MEHIFYSMRCINFNHPSQYYSSLSANNYRVSSIVKPTPLATLFTKPSPSVVPYEPFIRKPVKLINL